MTEGREVRVDLKPYVIKCKCDKCESGFLNYIQGSEPVESIPHMYVHQCDNCGDVQLAYRQYPIVQYEEIKPMKAVLDSEVIDDISE